VATIHVLLERLERLPRCAVGFVGIGVQLERGEPVVADVLESVEYRLKVEVSLAGDSMIVLSAAAADDVLRSGRP